MYESVNANVGTCTNQSMLICLLLFTCNYVVSVWRGFLFLLVLGMGYVILLWHSLSPPYNYYGLHWNAGHVSYMLFSSPEPKAHR